MKIVKRYNYCIFGGGGFYEYAYADLKQYENVRYYQDPSEAINSRWGDFLCRLTFSPKLNKFVKYPFKKTTFRYLANVSFKDTNTPIVFVLFRSYFRWVNSGFVEYLKQRYPSCKTVLYYQDLVKVNGYINLEYAKKHIDLILSYDQGDCEKYGFVYHPTPYSLVNIKDSDKYPVSDVFFCGKAKSRFGKVKSIYQKLQEQGLKCCFVVTGVTEEEREELPGMIYSEGISYLDNIRFEQNTKCILEIMQDDASGFTPRVWESIAYDKHLLTNNASLEYSEFFNSNYMHQLAEIGDVLSWINEPVSYGIEEKKQMSPTHFLEKIAANLDGHKQE